MWQKMATKWLIVALLGSIIQTYVALYGLLLSRMALSYSRSYHIQIHFGLDLFSK